MVETQRFASAVFGIAGWKKSGKTTLTSRLVAEFTRRGLKVSAIKHAHDGFQIDDGETDSARHRRSGAGQVAVVSAKRWAVVTELSGAPEPNFEEVVAALDPCDLVLVEGYKSAPIPKIEARRSASRTKRPLAADDPLVLAIASDHDCESFGFGGKPLPRFALDDVEAMADFISDAVLTQGGERHKQEAEA